MRKLRDAWPILVDPVEQGWAGPWLGLTGGNCSPRSLAWPGRTDRTVGPTVWLTRSGQVWRWGRGVVGSTPRRTRGPEGRPRPGGRCHLGSGTRRDATRRPRGSAPRRRRDATPSHATPRHAESSAICGVPESLSPESGRLPKRLSGESDYRPRSERGGAGRAASLRA